MAGDAAMATLEQLTDAALLESVRGGEHHAYGVLYARHVSTATRFARSIVSNTTDADDVVSEVFASVLSTLERGKGPVGTFLPYLMRSIRNECYRVNRRRGSESVDRFGGVEAAADAVAGPVDPFSRVDEASVLRVAFDSLPSNFQDVLWQTEVDEASPGDIAERRGGTPHAAAVMAARARQALGSAYLHQHLAPEHAPHDASPACRDVHPHLAGFVRGTVGSRRRRRLEAHLETCAACDDARHALGRVNKHLRIVPFIPLHLGRLGAASVSIKVQVVTWLSDAAAPMATSGAIAIGALMPTIVSDTQSLPTRPVVAVAEAPSADALALPSETVQAAVTAVAEVTPGAAEAAASPLLAAAETSEDNTTATGPASVRPQAGGSEASVDASVNAASSVGDGETPSIVFEYITTAMVAAPSAPTSTPTPARLIVAGDFAPTSGGSSLDDVLAALTGSLVGSLPGRTVGNGSASPGPERSGTSGKDATAGGTAGNADPGPSAGSPGNGGAGTTAGNQGSNSGAGTTAGNQGTSGAGDAPGRSGDDPPAGDGDTAAAEPDDGAPSDGQDGRGDDRDVDEGTDAGDDTGAAGDDGNAPGRGNGHDRDNGGRGHGREGDDDGSGWGHGNGHGGTNGGRGAGSGNAGGTHGTDADVPPVADDAGAGTDADAGTGADAGTDGDADAPAADGDADAEAADGEAADSEAADGDGDDVDGDLAVADGADADATTAAPPVVA